MTNEARICNLGTMAVYSPELSIAFQSYLRAKTEKEAYEKGGLGTRIAGITLKGAVALVERSEILQKYIGICLSLGELAGAYPERWGDRFLRHRSELYKNEREAKRNIGIVASKTPGVYELIGLEYYPNGLVESADARKIKVPAVWVTRFSVKIGEERFDGQRISSQMRMALSYSGEDRLFISGNPVPAILVGPNFKFREYKDPYLADNPRYEQDLEVRVPDLSHKARIVDPSVWGQVWYEWKMP